MGTELSAVCRLLSSALPPFFWVSLLKKEFTQGAHLLFLYSSSSTSGGLVSLMCQCLCTAPGLTICSFPLDSSGQGGMPSIHQNNVHPLCTPQLPASYSVPRLQPPVWSRPVTVLPTALYCGGNSTATGLFSFWLIHDPAYDRPSSATY